MSKPVSFLALVLSLWLVVAPCRLLEAAAQEPPKGSVDQALACKSPVELVGASLQHVADSLADRHSINVVLDARALGEVGVPADAPITITLRNATLHTALELMLSQLDLTISVKGDVLLITTRPRHVPFRGKGKHGVEEEDR
jgi:hypothetical protein